MKKKLSLALQELKKSFTSQEYITAIVNCVEKYADGKGELENLILDCVKRVDFGEHITVNTKWGNIDFFNSSGYPTYVDRTCAFWSIDKTSKEPSIKINIIFPIWQEITFELAPYNSNIETLNQGMSFNVSPHTLSLMLSNKYYERKK